MPTYEYQCEKCGKVFDHFQSMSSPRLETCPEEICPDKGKVIRLLGAGSGLIFKGSGFYITDYKKAQPGSKDSGGSSEGKSESKSEGGGETKPAESKPAETKSAESKPAAPPPASAS